MTDRGKRGYGLAAGLGWIAGMRSVAAPAWFSYDAARHPASLAGTPLAGLATRRAAGALGLAALGEMGLDKLPILPARTAPAPLAARVLAGALVGAAACVEYRRPVLAGAALGGAAAFLASHVLYRLRRQATTRLGLSNLGAGLIEDALVVALGRGLVGR